MRPVTSIFDALGCKKTMIFSQTRETKAFSDLFLGIVSERHHDFFPHDSIRNSLLDVFINDDQAAANTFVQVFDPVAEDGRPSFLSFLLVETFILLCAQTSSSTSC